MKKYKNPYKVIHNENCECCGKGKTYFVLCPNGALVEESFIDKKDAKYLANLLNKAYTTGAMSVIDAQMKETKEYYSNER